MKNHRCSGKSFSELFCLGCRDKVVVGIISLASGEPRENNHFLLHDGDHSTMVEFWSESGPQCKLILSPFESTATWHHLRGINLRSAGRSKKKKCGKRWERDADRVTERSDFPYSWTMWAEEQKETKYAGRWQRGNRRGRGLVRKYFSNTIAAAAFYACAEFLIELRIDDIQIYGLTKNSERGGRNLLFIPVASASRFKAFFNREIKYKGF